MERKRSSSIKSDFLKATIQWADDVCYGFDYLKLNLKSEIKLFSNILSMLDCDNSNSSNISQIVDWKLYELSLVKIRTKFWDCLKISVSFDDVVYNIWQYLEYQEKERRLLKSFWSMDISWNFFQLQRLGKFWEKFFENFFISLGNDDDYNVFTTSSISRADYKIDFCYNKVTTIPTPSEMLEIKKNNTTCKISEFWKWFETTNWSYWSKTSKYMFLRYYDKLEDTNKKMKQALYLDFLKYQSCFRFEAQASWKFLNARWLSYNIQQLDLVAKQFLEYFWLEKKTWNFKKDYWKATLFEFYDDVKKRQYIEGAWTRATNINKAGLPALQMIAEKMIDNEVSLDSLEKQLEDIQKMLLLAKERKENEIQIQIDPVILCDNWNKQREKNNITNDILQEMQWLNTENKDSKTVSKKLSDRNIS